MNPYLLISIEVGPRVVARLFSRLPRDTWDARIDPERFTPREIIAHLADWETEFLARMKLAKNQPGATIQIYDEGEWAIAHGYADQEPEEQIRNFQKRRQETASFVALLPPEDLELHVVHPETGRRTISDMANMLLGHDLYHIEQLWGELERSLPAANKKSP